MPISDILTYTNTAIGALVVLAYIGTLIFKKRPLAIILESAFNTFVVLAIVVFCIWLVVTW